jgi:hypothetical protein
MSVGAARIAARNDSEVRLLDKLMRDTRRANLYMVINICLCALLSIGLIRFLLPTYAFLVLSLVIIAIACVFIYRRWWNPITIGQYIERTMERDNLIGSAWMAISRSERLGFCDLNVKRAYEIAARFQVPPPWPILAVQVAADWVLRNKSRLLRYAFPALLLALFLLWLYIIMNLKSKPEEATRTKPSATRAGDTGTSERRGDAPASDKPQKGARNEVAGSKTGSVSPDGKPEATASTGSMPNEKAAGNKEAQKRWRDDLEALRKKVDALKKEAANKKDGAPAGGSKGEAPRALGELSKSLEKLRDQPVTPDEIAEAERTLQQLMKDNQSGAPGISGEDQKSLARGLDQAMRSLQAMKDDSSARDQGYGIGTGQHAMTGTTPPSDPNKRSIVMPDLPKMDAGEARAAAQAKQGGGSARVSPAQIDPDEVRPPGRPPQEYDKFLKKH